MRLNASIIGLFLLLAGCGGGGYQDYGVEPGMSPAAQAMPAERGREPRAQPGYQAQPAYQAQAGGYEQPSIQPEGYDRPDPGYDRPGASYDRPIAEPAPSYQRPAQQSISRPAASYDRDLAAQDSYADPAAGATGPSGSSRGNEARYDEVGYADVAPVEGGEAANAVVATHRSLPPGSFVEVTSLETGKTILVLVTGPMAGSDRIMDLSPGAARLLGGGGGSIPIRARRANPLPSDALALRSGQPASDRGDTPPVLLTALRKHLGVRPTPAYSEPAPSYSQPSYSRPAPARPAPARASGGGYFVQVAALSNPGRARALADSLGGFVRAGGGFHRVQLGPFRSPREAEAARGRAAASGFPDARVFTQN